MEIKEIKKIRKKIGLTQFELAKKANVSQSLIAKIESNKIDPAYSSVTKIKETFDRLIKSNNKTAKSIMNKKIITVDENSSIKSIVVSIFLLLLSLFLSDS